MRPCAGCWVSPPADTTTGCGVRVSRKRVARLMSELDIEGVTRRRFRTGTTKRDAKARPAPDARPSADPPTAMIRLLCGLLARHLRNDPVRDVCSRLPSENQALHERIRATSAGRPTSAPMRASASEVRAFRIRRLTLVGAGVPEPSRLFSSRGGLGGSASEPALTAASGFFGSSLAV